MDDGVPFSGSGFNEYRKGMLMPVVLQNELARLVIRSDAPRAGGRPRKLSVCQALKCIFMCVELDVNGMSCHVLREFISRQFITDFICGAKCAYLKTASTIS